MRAPTAVVGLALACNTPSAPGSNPTDEAPASQPSTPSAGNLPVDELLNVGDQAPSVTLTLQDGKRVSLDDLADTQVALFFYPMDDTPGCRAEAHGFRDLHDEFLAEGAVVYGVSLQGADSHRAFIEKEGLPFDLAVDDDTAISRAFGVPIRGQVAARQTFLLGETGKITHIWRRVDPRTHAREVLEAVKSGHGPVSVFQ
jgi:peroxiredoxin Q/BCP